MCESRSQQGGRERVRRARNVNQTTLRLMLCMPPRRHFIAAALNAAAALAARSPALAQAAKLPFPRWVETFRARARARGVSDATYTRVMANLKPDTAGFAPEPEQPEVPQDGWPHPHQP